MPKSRQSSAQLALRALLGALILGTGLAACVVEQAPPPRDPPAGGAAQSPPPGGNCGEPQDACVARCKAAAPDEASRQPCYNDCMRASAGCR